MSVGGPWDLGGALEGKVVAMNLEAAFCEHMGYAHFDRTLCACGEMHSYCDDCGKALGCPLDEVETSRSYAGSEPVMVEIKDGWAAVGEGWAVVATLERDARFKYAEAVKLHREIAARPWPHGAADSKSLRVAAMPAHRCLDIERLAEALDAPGVFEDPLGSAAMELAESIVREYEALEQAAAAATDTPSTINGPSVSDQSP